ncbi:CcdC protein domain-containing protein [Sphingomonas sp. CJ20]
MAAMHPAAHAPSWPSFVFPILVVVVVLALRMRRMARERPLKIEYLWVVPALYLVVAGAMFVRFPPSPIGAAVSLVALAVGAALGWQRGKLMRITVDPQTHAISQRGSVAAMLFIVVLILVRMGAREAATLGGASLHIDVMLVTDVLVALALGLLSAQRLEMYLRARRLLEQARAA